MEHVENMVGILVPISLFAMVTLMVIVPRYFRSLERQRMADTVRLAIEKGQPLPPEVIGALTTTDDRPPRSPAGDLRRGLILVGVGLGMAVAGLTGLGEGHINTGLAGAGAIPGFIGLAYIVMYFIEKPKA